MLSMNMQSCSQQPSKKDTTMNYNNLTPEERHVIIDKGTERPFVGKYVSNHDKGTYVCKQCGAALYRSSSKFDSQCGWPSFDEEIEGAVKRVPDADGRRTEIVCAHCGGHLGHVFLGEGLTPKNTRHCVNSISMNFIADSEKVATDTAIFASGCFWGTQYWLGKADGVLSTSVGYTGGHTQEPTYPEVCTGTTGHAEAVQVVFDPTKTTYETLVKLFFETHDPTQHGGQGPDIGDQYRSEIFYTSESQKETAEKVVAILVSKRFDVATKVTKASTFWKGEDYHQDYYEKKHGRPYCHVYKKIF